MSATDLPVDTQAVLSQIEVAAAEGKLSAGAVDNLRVWLTEPRYAEFVSQVAEHVERGMWKELDDVFWTIIPFGTGGRRGKMYAIGSNAINDRTIGESAQGLADYVKDYAKDHAEGKSGRLSCAIAYDTRHRSRRFAELCAGIMAAAGFKVWFLDGFRSTPELSFAVRYKKCDCGIIITASHNPPSDNAIKAYWSCGGQLLPPHDRGVIDRVMSVEEIRKTPFDECLVSGQVEYCQEEVDKAFLDAVLRQSRPGPRDLKIIYSPLHGVGASAVIPALAAAGFADVELFGPHASESGDFPNVPGHVSNPENPRVFDIIIERAKRIGGELIMATDPDCDRMGCAAPKTSDIKGPWDILTGNQIGSMLAAYLLDIGRRQGTLTADSYIVKTMVTTELFRRIGDSHGVRTVGDLLVGFKWIGQAMDEHGPAGFIFGAEESYGYLAGAHVRDKDAAVSSMLMAELAAEAKASGLSLHEKLDELFREHGCHRETQVSAKMPGSEGMDRMRALMQQFRAEPPGFLGGIKVARLRDYLNQTVTPIGGEPAPLAGPRGDVVILDLESEGNYVAVRPSGTEPKVKFYIFAYDPPLAGEDLEARKQAQAERIAAMQADLTSFAGV